MSTTLIEQINAIIETGEVSRAGLARAAGLHPNSLRKLGQPDWNPTADTLGRLEKLIQRGTTDVLVGTEAIINEARNGRMFILVDDESRENEGDLVIPAQMATPDAINFMARLGRGLIVPVRDQVAPGCVEEGPVGAADRIDANHPAAIVDRKPQGQHRFLFAQQLRCRVGRL